MRLDENTIGMWYVEATIGGNWTAILYRDGNKLCMDCRTRIYNDDKAHNSEDRKRFMSGTLAEGTTVEQAIEKCRWFAKNLPLREGEVSEILMGPGGLDEFFKTLAMQPWAHMKAPGQENPDTKH